MANAKEELIQGLTTAFVDGDSGSNLAWRPRFLSNDYEKGQKVLSSLEDELKDCDEFAISVAFITRGGITPLLQTLKELEKLGIPGRILTTNYLNFSEPTALRRLGKLKNIKLRMFDTEAAGEGFHTKGYIFRKNEVYRIIVGSSNLTMGALTKNKEWNTRLVSSKKGEYTEDIRREFEHLWNSPYAYNFDDFIEDYEIRYETVKEQRRIAAAQQVVVLEDYKLTPNAMQTEFIKNLARLREKGKDHALLVSATGTGKSLASAFAMRAEKQRKVLFLVHREQIARQAMASYKRVFGNKVSYGLLSGQSHPDDLQAIDYLFCTMNMMAKEGVRGRFAKDAFQTIIIDEAHRTGANSYIKIMDYFTPQLWLGMTASPERTDDFDVFAAFDHNIACEIRLQQALEENLLCPFHYFGITDLTIDGEAIDDETGLRDFNRLTADTRVSYVLEQAEYYGHSGDRVKGLIFCSSKKEAAALSGKFNRRFNQESGRDYRTIALSGEDSQEKREAMVEKLVSDDPEQCLDYIFTIDIFNEGVDIPEINQVIMLRPTQSPIVFVQQLGRGLRKAENKEFIVVLDFIGNYKNNFMIPIALSGDRTFNKDNVRRYVMEGERVIPGSSTMHFDAISRKRIFESIDHADFSNVRLIRENYKNLKYKLGRIPRLMDFERYGEMDVTLIFDRMGSYYNFLVKNEKDYKVRLTEKQASVIEFISKKLACGKRVHELELLQRMLSYKTKLMAVLRTDLRQKYDIEMDRLTEENVVNVMTNEFPSGSGRKTYADAVFLESDGSGDYNVAPGFQEMMDDPDFCEILKELVDFGIYRNKKYYADRYKKGSFVLYQKYTYEDVCRLLNWDKNVVPLNIGGYKYDERTKTFPVFINYDKSDDIQDTVKYEDHFEKDSNEYLLAISKGKRTLESNDVQDFLYCEERGIDVELFIRKNKDDKISKEFYYMGSMKPTGKTREFIMPNTNVSAVEIEWKLDTPVRQDIYQYIVKE